MAPSPPKSTSTRGWSEDRPWSDPASDPPSVPPPDPSAAGTASEPLATDVDQALAAHWEVLEPYADTVAQSPTETIVPTQQLRTTAGERALAAVRIAEAPLERLKVGEDVLGVGGMSVVRRGRQTALDREVAVKELPERDMEARRAALELLREAWITGRLEHPNVVPVYDLALDSDGRPRLVMKRIEGVRWTDLMREPEVVRTRYGATDALAWHLGVFMQVCHAVHYAHERGVIHRDLKPDNVMVGSYGEVYVLDWGIAVTTGDSSILTSEEPTSMAGTPPYMAPEMLQGGPITIRTDVYLLGGLLFELIAGDPPHHGKSLEEIARKVLASEPALPPDAPPELVAIIRRALARRPENRFEDAEALRRAVQMLLEQREARLLAQAATRDLDRLEELAAQAHGAVDDGDERAELYDVYGACRFGFRAALARFPEDRTARQGLIRAVETMAELELARGNASGAQALLSELEAPPADLIARVKAARESDAARRQKLERIAFHHDRAVGTRPRWRVLWALTIVWAAIPFWQSLRPVTWAEELVRPLIYLALLLVVLLFKREKLATNLYNRRLWAIGTGMFGIELVFTAGQWLAGMDPVVASVQDHVVHAFGAVTLAIFLEPVLWIGAAGYSVAFLAGTRWPEYRVLFDSLANVSAMGPLLWAWRPSRLDDSPPDDSPPDDSGLSTRSRG